MKEYTLVGVDGNAWSVMAYVTRAMKDAYKEASTPDSDGQVAEVAKWLRRPNEGGYSGEDFINDGAQLVNHGFQDWLSKQRAA